MDAGFEQLRLVYGFFAVVVALLPAARARRLGGAGLAALGLGAAAEVVGGAEAPGSFTSVNLILAGTGIALVVAALYMTLRGAGEPAVSPAAPLSGAGHPGLDGFLLAGLTLASAGPHLILIGLGLVLSIVGAARGAVRSGMRLWLVPLIAGAGLLSTALFLTLTILGPMGDAVMVLPSGPFSPPAERMLVLLFAGGALLLAGLPPLTRAPWRLALAPVGAVLLVRVLRPGFPQGLADWQPLAMLLLTAMFTAAALTRRWPLMAVVGGLATLWAGDRRGVLAGWVLVLWGWLADQAEALRAARGISLSPRWAGVAALVPGLAALPALESVLRAAVVLPTLAALAAIVGFGLGVRRRANP